MSSTDHRGIPPGNAAIIAAVIGAVALILGAKSQTIQVFLGADTPTAVAQSNTFGLHSPQPTYTLLPTYTPYPTLKPNVTVVTPKPLIVTATPSVDRQDPPPGSTIQAGQGFSRNGVEVTMGKALSIYSDEFIPNFLVENQSGQQLIVLWKESFIHARDDKGKVYPQFDEDSPNYNSSRQFSISNGNSQLIGSGEFVGAITFSQFKGNIDPSSKYLIFTVDQLSWHDQHELEIRFTVIGSDLCHSI